MNMKKSQRMTRIKTNKIFTRGFNDYTNVTVGGNFTNENSYIIGYWEAGDILVDKAMSLNHPFKDRLFFPICYNYRQFIELCLKDLVLSAEKVYNDCESINTQRKSYKQKFSERINKTHSIELLMNWLNSILDCITNEKMDNNIKNFILEYHQMDKTGQKFRYPISTRNIMHFEVREDFDLENIKNGIKKTGMYLLGIDAYLFELGNYVKIQKKEMEEMYYYEYE